MAAKKDLGRTKDGKVCRLCRKLGRRCHLHPADGVADRKPYKFDAEKRRAYLEALEEQGMTRTAAADYVGVHRSTVAAYRKKDEEFAVAESQAEGAADAQVENALFKNATTTDSRGRYNTGAQAFWLKNRAPDRWKDMKIHEVVQRMKQEEREPFFRALAEAGVSPEQLERAIAILESGVEGDAGESDTIH